MDTMVTVAIISVIVATAVAGGVISGAVIFFCHRCMVIFAVGATATVWSAIVGKAPKHGDVSGGRRYDCIGAAWTMIQTS